MRRLESVPDWASEAQADGQWGCSDPGHDKESSCISSPGSSGNAGQLGHGSYKYGHEDLVSRSLPQKRKRLTLIPL
ncbi:hypothetical protein H4Q26_006468 [Puccinia striiformis f. sp. tritici PST-130]|nr:hypothetical protein H4Q26_006468 [Puccinia striiformis f. sp. tritici PST-130]